MSEPLGSKILVDALPAQGRRHLRPNLKNLGTVSGVWYLDRLRIRESHLERRSRCVGN
jgi:hypothetical protein